MWSFGWYFSLVNLSLLPKKAKREKESAQCALGNLSLANIWGISCHSCGNINQNIASFWVLSDRLQMQGSMVRHLKRPIFGSYLEIYHLLLFHKRAFAASVASLLYKKESLKKQISPKIFINLLCDYTTPVFF